MVSEPHYLTCPFCRGFHWYKFLSLESKLVDISKHITLDKRNFETWGNSIADLLVLTGNAMDTFFRDISDCPNFVDNKYLSVKERKELNIIDYQKIFEDYYELSKNHVIMQFELGESIEINPFENFEKIIPRWWTSYNTTKHQFYAKLSDANLGNAISCLGGLFILNALHLCNSCYLAFHGDIESRYSTIAMPYYTVRELIRSKIGTTVWGNPYTIMTDIFDFTYRVDDSIGVHSPVLMDIEEWLKEQAQREDNPIAR